jgi:4-hydroxy-tetrahydrodipicolinate synthase
VASEFETLEAAERTHLVDVVAARVAGRIPLVVGASATDGARAAAHAAQARAIGAAAVMAVAPASLTGNKPAIRDYYARIAAEGVPVILQNAPPPAGCALTADDVIDLVATIDGIRYVKEETLPCGQRITRILAAELPALAGVFGGAGGR